jgi:hypothetical protein
MMNIRSLRAVTLDRVFKLAGSLVSTWFEEGSNYDETFKLF